MKIDHQYKLACNNHIVSLKLRVDYTLSTIKCPVLRYASQLLLVLIMVVQAGAQKESETNLINYHITIQMKPWLKQEI